MLKFVLGADGFQPDLDSTDLNPRKSSYGLPTIQRNFPFSERRQRQLSIQSRETFPRIPIYQLGQPNTFCISEPIAILSYFYLSMDPNQLADLPSQIYRMTLSSVFY